MGALSPPVRDPRRREPRSLPPQRAVLSPLLAGVADHSDEIVDRVLDGARELAGYAELPEGQRDDLALTVRRGLDAVLLALSQRRPLAAQEIAFLREHIGRRAKAGVPEGDMLAVVRLFERVVWDTIHTLADGGRQSAETVLDLTRPLLQHIEALSREVCIAFALAGANAGSAAAKLQAELLDVLLRSGTPPPGPLADLAARLGLGAETTLLVLTVTGADADALPTALREIVAALRTAREPLAAVRDAEITAVVPAKAEQVEPILGALRLMLDDGTHTAWSAGISTLRWGRHEIPAAYAEARLAAGRSGGGRLVALCELDIADYLIVRGADETAWRLVPERVRQWVTEDSAGYGALADTLLTYLDCDLNVRAAAERLFIHPNTVHYRLARIEERTGLSVRRPRDLLTLAAAVRLHRTASTSSLSTRT